MKLWTRNISFLILIGTALGGLGLLSGDLYRVFAFLSFVIFASTFQSVLRISRDSRFPEVVAAASFALIAVAMYGWADLGLFHLYLFLSVSLLILSWRKNSRDVSQLGTYVVALACVGVLAELVRIFPVLWHLRMEVASVQSWIGQRLAQEDRNLGPTAMALPLLVSLVVLLLVREAAAESRRRFRWVAGVLILVAAHLFYLVGLKYYARWIISNRPAWDWLILNSQHLFLILGSIVFTLIDRGRAMRSFRVPSVGRVAYVSVFTFAVGLVAAMTLAWTPAPRHGAHRVMIYDAGYVNWKVPVHGVYGERSAGMFGLLPSALEAVGFDVVVSGDVAQLDGPEAPDCAVMINIQEYFDDEEKATIWRFISNGGGLLCLGDHTSVAGIRGPFNDLLQPVGIRFRFDSSTFFGQGWNEALDYRPHPLNRGVETAEDFQIWVGATLDLDLKAYPVVVGRYGYSDIGNAANIERSYLGDRRYNPSELLGDVVLVADARHGAGKVMVFGDTSGYQNLSLARTLDSITRSLDHLSSDGGFGPGLPVQFVALALILLFVSAGLLYARNPMPVVAVALGLAVGSAVLHLATPTPRQITPAFQVETPEFTFSPTPHVKRELAVLDASHGGYHTLRGWEEKSIGGLQLNLARNGYFSLMRPEFPYEDLKRGAALLLVVAPTRPYNQNEIDAIEQFVRGGGRVIASVGFEELHASRGFLNHFGLSIANVPLGRFEVRAEGDTLGIVFREGWPVQFDDGAPTEVLVSEWNHPLVVKRLVGDGQIVLIGDSSFFHDANLESRDEYYKGNIAFLKKLAEAGEMK
jgi:hypothetical protein